MVTKGEITNEWLDEEVLRIAKVKKQTAPVAATKDVPKTAPVKKVEEAPKKAVTTVTPTALKSKPAKKK